MNVLLSTIGNRGYLAPYFRSALANGSKIIGTSYLHSVDDELTPGFSECDLGIVVPAINSSGYLERVLDVCKNHNIRLITSLYDMDALVLSKSIETFSSRNIYPVLSSYETNKICFDKTATNKFLDAIDLKYPTTWSTHEDVPQDNFPIIFKTRLGAGGDTNRIVKSPDELANLFVERPNSIAQPYLLGAEFGIDVFVDANGKAVTSIAKRKIRQRHGDADQAITINDTRLIELGILIGESLPALGPLDIDVIEQGNTLYVIDLNCRIGGLYPLSHEVGAAFPKKMLSLLNGDPIPSELGNYPSHVVMQKVIAHDFFRTVKYYKRLGFRH